MVADFVELKNALICDLAERIGPLGFEELQSTDGAVGVSFAKMEAGVPSARSVIELNFGRFSRGGLKVSSWAKVQSRSLLELYSVMPQSALLRDGEPLRDFVDRVDFDMLVDLSDPMSLRPIMDRGGAKIRGQWIRDAVEGPVEKWFERRSSLESLVSLAKSMPKAVSSRKVSPGRLRSTVLLCLVNDFPDDAASLMDWYTAFDTYNVLDSRERIDEFDEILKSRFPQYAKARRS